MKLYFTEGVAENFGCTCGKLNMASQLDAINTTNRCIDIEIPFNYKAQKTVLADEGIIRIDHALGKHVLIHVPIDMHVHINQSSDGLDYNFG